LSDSNFIGSADDYDRVGGEVHYDLSPNTTYKLVCTVIGDYSEDITIELRNNNTNTSFVLLNGEDTTITVGLEISFTIENY
jgi:hypothetical protein